MVGRSAAPASAGSRELILRGSSGIRASAARHQRRRHAEPFGLFATLRRAENRAPATGATTPAHLTSAVGEVQWRTDNPCPSPRESVTEAGILVGFTL